MLQQTRRRVYDEKGKAVCISEKCIETYDLCTNSLVSRATLFLIAAGGTKPEDFILGQKETNHKLIS